MKDLTIIIPAFNEQQAIEATLNQVKAVAGDIVEEIIVVDDGSEDVTAKLAERVNVTVIRHPVNRGYGAALKTGLRSAKTPFVLMMDSDGQHRAEDVLTLWNVACKGDTDMVVGQRTELLHSSLWRMPGKWLLSFMANYITQQKIPDLNSGMRIIRREVALRYMHLCPAGFSFSTTITIALLCRGYRVLYEPIQVNKRIGKSTVSLATGLNTIILLLRIATLFDPLRVFAPLSMIIALIGLIWEIPYALTGRGVSVGSMLAIVTAALLFSLGLLSDQISQLRLERYE